ncbi:hypothetical protein [Enterococcus hermanniensis]|uniref:Membrane protein 6-pyruvoyl-tetrahydropterin synthase-related domain-containing protein n=1 Tax=Enterococcus hermanniensis TaxID=249189 RepID=A0A1L8TMR6_9ENTE|nr:hypothetical protein [Enterococcus hermanniensis]OJG45570.1 hypothetical protein RV04_GL001859 [Enterococcus hermanniensis]
MKKYHYYIIILIIAGLFVLPQLWTHKMILGADAIFHYNRFYETAQQIKTGHFSYFISIFGFQQSGRITNAVYGPVFAYFQGVLVLLAGSWFHYQVLSNFLVYVIAGCSLFKLLTYAKLNQNTALFTSIIFMTTYSINYWVLNQGFTSWGTAILPLCLIPIVDLKNSRFPFIKMGVSMALMTQIHMLTAVMLGLIYLPFFISYAKHQWKRAIIDIFKAIFIYLCLSINVWISLIVIETSDQLKMPFVNAQMSEKAINLKGFYWLEYPGCLRLLLVIGLIICLVYWKAISTFTKQLLLLSGLFLLLSTSLIPWTWMVAHQIPFVSLIQFPFRFFAPFTVLYLFFFASIIHELRARKILSFVLIALSMLSIGQNLKNNQQELSLWESRSLVSKHTFVTSSEKAARQSFFSNDLGEALRTVQKSSPDYLPIYHGDANNKYVSYEEQILEQSPIFSKTIIDNHLELTWQAEKTGEIQLPVILYHYSKLISGTTEITPIKRSNIGLPTIQQKPGKNTIHLRYDPPSYMMFVFIFCTLSWFSLFLWCGYRFWQQKS